MAVVNAGEWMEEPLLKASIDPLPAPEESKGLNVAQGFLGRHKGTDRHVHPSTPSPEQRLCINVIVTRKKQKKFETTSFVIWIFLL